MPKQSSVTTSATHPKRTEIDAALLRADSFRHVAVRFNVSTGALQRHRNEHIAEQLSRAKEVSDVAAASNLVDELLKLTRKTGEVLSRALREKDGELALKAIARLEKQLELKGRLLGQLEERGRGVATHVVVTYVDKMLVTAGAPAPTAARTIEAAGENIEQTRR